MVEDYADRPGWRGEPLFPAERFDAHRHRGRPARPADRGARHRRRRRHAWCSTATRQARRANGPRDSRHRIEHIEVIHARRYPALRRARRRRLDAAAASAGPTMGLPLEPTVSRIGEARWPYAYAWNTACAAGARMVFRHGLAGLAARPDRFDPGRAWCASPGSAGLPDHRQTLMQALARLHRRRAPMSSSWRRARAAWCPACSPMWWCSAATWKRPRPRRCTRRGRSRRSATGGDDVLGMRHGEPSPCPLPAGRPGCLRCGRRLQLGMMLSAAAPTCLLRSTPGAGIRLCRPGRRQVGIVRRSAGRRGLPRLGAR